MTANRFPLRLALLSAMFFFVFMGAGAQQAYIVPYLKRVAGWSALRAGTVVAMVYFSMMVFRVLNVYLFGAWSDRRFTVVGSLTYLMFTLAMLATAFARSYPLALAAAAVWGAGGAMMWTGTTMQTLAVADRRSGRHGTGMGILYASTHAGWLSGAIVLGKLYDACDDVHLYAVYVLAAALTFLGILVASRLPPVGRPSRQTPNLPQALATALRGRMLIPGLLLLTSALAFGVVLGGLGGFIQDTYGKGWIWIAIAFYPGTRMVMSLVGGYLTDRIGQTAVLAGGFAAGAAGLALAGLWRSPFAIIVTAFALGLLSSTVPVAASAMVGAGAEIKRRPLVYGIMFSWRDLGVAAAAVGVNVLGVKLDFETGLAVFAGVFAACAVLSLALRRFAGQEM